MAGITFSLNENAGDFAKAVNEIIKKHAIIAINSSINDIIKKLEPIIYDEIYNSPAMEAIRGGSLRGELGLTSSKAQQASEDIARMVSGSIFIESNRGTGRVLASLTIGFQPSDFNEALSISGSTIDYFSKTYNRIVSIEWLDWLLTKGDRIIVNSFHFESGSKGRSGDGNMKPGKTWRISPRYAGTTNDNFITRAINKKGTQAKIIKVVKAEIKSNWK
tara:strand:+ start:172 stop:828 length:657 start_codon:yes stop_codon:yes gene_type:complete